MDLQAAAEARKSLGWDIVLEERISTLWLAVAVATPLLRKTSQFLLPSTWDCLFMQIHRDTGRMLGRILHQAYQVFQVEVHLGGAIFGNCYNVSV